MSRQILKTETITRIQEVAKKNPPNKLKAGDYVELGPKVRDLLNAKQVMAFMKDCQNKCYIHKIEPDGMMTLLKRRGSTSDKLLVPKTVVRYMLTNVQDE